MTPGLTYSGPAPQFDIVTEPGHGTGVGDWVVKGEWHGSRRVLFVGDPWGMRALGAAAGSGSGVKAGEVKAALCRRHSIESWVCIEEAFGGFATSGGGVDLLALGAWRSAKLPGLPGAGRASAANPIVVKRSRVLPIRRRLALRHR